MSEGIVLAFSGASGNDAIQGLILEISSALEQRGLATLHVHVTSDQAELAHAVELMQQGAVKFAVTWLGFLQELQVSVDGGARTVNAWDFFGVPLVKIHGDIPAYFSDRHRDVPRCSANLYMAPEFMRFRRDWMPDARSLAAVLPPWPIGSIARDTVDVHRRERGTLVFLKNGNAPADLVDRWRATLPPAVSAMLLMLAEELRPAALAGGRFDVGDAIARVISNLGVDPASINSQMLFLAAQMDDYLRRVKSEMIARALLDFPVVIQGDAWGHVDFAGRRATHRAGRSFFDSKAIFAEELGVIDMSPNIDEAPHDRVQRAAGAYALVLTNRQTWLAESLPQFNDMQFEFRPDSIGATVDAALSYPRQSVERGIAFGEAFRQRYPVADYAATIVRCAEMVRIATPGAQPRPQAYFMWPQL